MVNAKQTTASGRQVFIARQPILDRDQAVYGYELLFRSGLGNVFNHADANQASAKVMTDGSLLMDIEAVSGGRRAFINITRDILLKDFMLLLPKELTAAEILETIDPTPEIVEACSRLKKAGYLIVLDDFVFGEHYADLMALADIVKVDFLATDKVERREILSRFTSPDVRFLAEKVETHESFQEGLDLGYSYFQGYFFSKPMIMATNDIPGFKMNYLALLRQIQAPDADFRRLEEVVKRDMALSYKLLRYINSAYFGLTNKVSSIMHAISLLGVREFKQWASLLAMASMGQDKPDALTVQVLVRARFCELLGTSVGMRHRSQELFLTGMFSLVDAILDRPMEAVLKDLPLADEIKAALGGTGNRLSAVLAYVLAYEKGDWERLGETSRALGLDEADVPQFYQKSVQWAQQSFELVRSAE